jgi:hypothetical protein
VLWEEVSSGKDDFVKTEIVAPHDDRFDHNGKHAGGWMRLLEKGPGVWT